MPTVETKKASRRKRRKPAKLSRLYKPQELSLEAWQVELRRQFGREQKFQIKKVGAEPVFSDFQITNPQTKNSYRVAIRGSGLGENFCSCPDFATNTLGTCKHIEFTLAKVDRQRGASEILRQGFQPSHSEVYLRYGAQREVRLRKGTDCPPALARVAEKYFDSDGLLSPDAFHRFEEFLSASSRFDHDLRCFDDVLGFVAEVRDRQNREEKLKQIFPRGIDSPAFEKLLRVPLYDYQREGALFAVRAGRCLIGDEMGLGKTIQAIAAVEIFARNFGVERVLIICPTSLKHQWEREIEKFADRSAHAVGGLRPRRQRNYAEKSFYKITNYDTVHADMDLINAWSPDLVILDEAQRIKNWNTRTARSVKRLASPYAIVLTGTPLENRLEELVSIVQFVDRHRIGPTFRFLADHQIHDGESGRVIGYKNLDSIGKTLAPILIRRRKKEVLAELPERLDKHLFVPMTPQQMTHHEENRDTVARVVAKWRKFKFLSEADQRRLMIGLQNMRMSCDSTFLLDQETDFGVKADELATQLDEMLEQPDVKVVIFSQWLRMHEILVRRLRKRKWNHVVFHGSVPGGQRKKLVDRFREDELCRAFLATDAGGVGLNLQHASVVVNVDLPWNPAVLEQRIGRVHRLGQRQPVRVVNFVSQGTIEEGMLSTLKFKQSLFAGALDGGEKEVFLGGTRLNRFIQTVEKATGAIPEPAPQDSPAPPEHDGDTSAGETQSASRSNGQNQPTGGSANSPGNTQFTPEESTAAPGASPADPWTGLLQTGLALLEKLAAASRQESSRSASSDSSPANAAPSSGLSIIHRDAQTGETFLKFPVPSAEVVDQVLGAVSALLERFKK
jgi:superfamily II DNA or RNA helicase